MSPPIRVGSRGSDLALIQAREVMNALDEPAELVIIETHGDRVTDRPLSQVGGAGLFIKEIESALIDDRIDLAVHSMKDVPSVVPEGLSLAATLARLDARDALVSKTAPTIAALSHGAHIATGSLRRRSQLLAIRPDLVVDDLRGNVGTRLDKFDASSWDAVVLAAAGLMRLGLEARIRAKLPVDEMIPAVGQGALAIETRTDDRRVRSLVEALNHPATQRAVACERAFLGRLEGGCQVPIGAFAEIEQQSLRLLGYVGSVDGSRRLRREATGALEAPEALGLALAEQMLEAGAGEIIGEIARSDANR
jgi:hydroxymethylbilane synthase